MAEDEDDSFQSAGGTRIDSLRKAIEANRINFPVPVPIFPSQFRPDLQWRLVELYFVRGWSSRQLAERYGLTARRIQQSLQHWADYAVARGYLQEIPPERTLTPSPVWAMAVPAILIATGDPELRHSMRNSLLPAGFLLTEAPSAQAALDMGRHRKFDLILVNLQVPDYDDAEFCRRFRARSPSIGIIVVRAGDTKDVSDDDEWRLLEAGADDYVTAPFRYREIVARIGAVLKRPRTPGAKSRVLLRAGDIELDLRRHLIRRGGNPTRLSPREFELLAVLMANPGTALTHTRLARSAWRDGAPHNRELLRTYIQSLRQKLEHDSAHPKYILTEPWVGYRFCDPQAAT
jgi:two-component system KDP operon response regulator KdpE